MRSTIEVLVGQEPESAVVVLTRATLAAVALIAMVPVTSGVGRLLTPLVPKLSATRKYWPGWSVTFDRAVTCQAVPVAAAYCTDQPLSDCGEAPRLNSAM